MPWSVPVAIELDKRLNVLFLVESPEELNQSLPLISSKPLETPATVEQGPVEIEEHGLDTREHRFLYLETARESRVEEAQV
jgi:hypothetical protein